MSESPEISVEFLSITGLMNPSYLIKPDGKQYVVLSMEIGVPLGELASLMELTSVKPVTLRATSSR